MAHLDDGTAKQNKNFLSIFCGSPQTPRRLGGMKGKEIFGFVRARH